MKAIPIPQTTSKYWPFKGGVDQVTQSITLPPGVCRYASNVEVGPTGSLSVTQGYERYDGRFKPSDGAYYVMNVNITGSYALGNTITGVTSGATGVLIAVTATYFVTTKVAGIFVAGESLTIAAVTIATATGGNDLAAAPTIALNSTYRNLAAANYRADITVVPGSGSVLGVHQYNGDKYAVRNNAGETQAVLFKHSAAGWIAVDLGRDLSFTAGGTLQVVAGNTITGATSGATAVVTKVILNSGTWSGGTAAGRFIFASQTGIFQSETLRVGATNVATIAGNSAANTLAPSGRYEFYNHNFGGLASTLKVYGASGTHRGFEFDGTVFAFITTGMVVDTPTHVIVNKQQLFFSFSASVQHSGIGNPFTFSPVLGAAELAVGDAVTNFVLAPGSATGGALVIYSRNSTRVLYGNDPSSWNLVPFNPDAGALGYTAQYLTQGIALDDRGVTMMSTSQVFGNFASADASVGVRPYVSALRDTAIASCVVRDKNQYRIFFSGGAALYVTFIGTAVAGSMPVALSHPVTCASSLEAATGVEEIFFGSSNGYVYQMERGTSHDGESLNWSAELSYNHFGSPRLLKSFRKAVLEITGHGYAEFSLTYNVGYGNNDLPQGVSATLATSLMQTVWDAMVWDHFYWDGQTLIPAEADLDGTAENISLTFAGASAEFDPITLNGAIVSFTQRRPLR